MFDSLNRRTCLHYAAYYGHSDCLEAIISAAHSAPVAVTWLVFLIVSGLVLSCFDRCLIYLELDVVGRGFIRYVNIRDGGGATPLHIAARRRQPQCIRTLLANGALACALTCAYG